MTIHIRVLGADEEALLFQLLGIRTWQEEEGGLLILGTKEAPPVDHDAYVRLPDPEDPLAETRRLAAQLGRAVGQRSVRL